MYKFLAPLVVLPLLFATPGCASFQSWLNTPVTPVSTGVDQKVTDAFNAADFALMALPLVPGMPANVVQEAKAADAALKAAYNTYKANPGDTKAQAAVQDAVAAAQAFMANQATNPQLKSLVAPK